MANSDLTFEAIQHRLKELTRIVEVSLVLNSTMAIEPLLRYIMDAAKELVEAESAAILLVDKNTQELVFRASDTGGVSDLIGKPVPLEGSIAGRVMRKDAPVAINDVSRESGHYRQVDEQIDFQTRSVLGVPMRIKQDVVGVLEAVNKRDGSWAEEDIEALSVLAAHAAIAIENAQLIAQLRQANSELESLDKLKNDFISIASHELRTPLGIILGYASFLKEDTEGEALELADVVFKSALQLRSIIEQLTNLRYLKAGEIELQRKATLVSEILQLAEQDIASLANARDHELVINPPAQDCAIHVDAHKIQAALGNLLNNAVKFTPNGGHIVVDAVLKPAEVWLLVQDNGIGLAPEHLEQVFDEFFQVEDHLTRRHGGMGLGLSIARALVEAHQGRIWVESPGLNQGCTFYISLPRASG